MSNEVNVTTSNTEGTILAYLGQEKVRTSISKVLGSKTDSFCTSIISAVKANPELAKCTNNSLINAALIGNTMGLLPSPQLGQMYFVPYKNHKTGYYDAQFQMSYKGYVQLAIRSGQYEKIVVSDVREGELKGFDPFTESIKFTPIMDYEARRNAPIIGWYSYFKLLNGFEKMLYWSAREMDEHARKYSVSYASDIKDSAKKSFWSKNYPEMAKKTVLKHLISKYGILSVDMQTALVNDQAVIDDEGQGEYVDNPDEVVVEPAKPNIADNAVEAENKLKAFKDTIDKLNNAGKLVEGCEGKAKEKLEENMKLGFRILEEQKKELYEISKKGREVPETKISKVLSDEIIANALSELKVTQKEVEVG